MKLYQEKKQTKEWKMQQLQQQNQLICGLGNDDDLKQRTRSQNYEVFRKGKIKSHRRASMGSALDILSLSSKECTVCSLYLLLKPENSQKSKLTSSLYGFGCAE